MAAAAIPHCQANQVTADVPSPMFIESYEDWPRDQSRHLDNSSDRALTSQHDPNIKMYKQDLSYREVEVVLPHFVMSKNLEDSWNRELRLSEEHAVSLGFAIGEVLTARGRLLDMLETIEQC